MLLILRPFDVYMKHMQIFVHQLYLSKAYKIKIKKETFLEMMEY